MDGTSSVPVAAGDGGQPGHVRRAHRPAGPLRLPLGGTRARRRALRARDDGRRVPLPGRDLRRRRRRAVQARHARLRPRRALRRHARRRRPTPASGCSSSARRTPASSSRPACSSGRSGSSSPRRGRPSCRSTRTRCSASGRATCCRSRTRSWAAACSSSNASIDAHRALGDGLPRSHARSDGSGELDVEADEVIAATGFTCSAARPAGARRGGLRAQPAAGDDQLLGERHGARHLLRRHDRPGRAGMKKYGLPANSGAVHGARYNARTMADHVAEQHFGVELPREPVSAERARRPAARGGDRAPELWNQKSYLARAFSLGPDGPFDEGIVPLPSSSTRRAPAASRSRSRPMPTGRSGRWSTFGAAAPAARSCSTPSRCTNSAPRPTGAAACPKRSRACCPDRSGAAPRAGLWRARAATREHQCEIVDVGAARGWSRGARGRRARRWRASAIASTGRGRCPASATSAPAC